MLWEWGLHRFVDRKHIHGLAHPAKSVVPGALLLLLRPGSYVSSLPRWVQWRVLVLVREVVSALWRDAA